MAAHRGTYDYSAIIRTFQSFPVVEEVVRALRRQSIPPRSIIVVDSGSSEQDRTRLRDLADIFIDYPPEPFNFSKAINLGVAEVSTQCCLIISSHFLIEDTTLIARSIQQMAASGAGAFYVSNVCRKGTEKYTLISASNFTGFNGFSNACGFVPKAMVQEHCFREDVFACEDQEWAAWYLQERYGSILKIVSPSIRYLNPHANLTKKLNEELAVAAFVDRRRLSGRHVFWRLLRAAFFIMVLDWPRAAFEHHLARELWQARRRIPQKPSRYF
jgi:glycosyltransferase involved in cell wall biosynthesis